MVLYWIKHTIRMEWRFTKLKTNLTAMVRYMNLPYTSLKLSLKNKSPQIAQLHAQPVPNSIFQKQTVSIILLLYLGESHAIIMAKFLFLQFCCYLLPLQIIKRNTAYFREQTTYKSHSLVPKMSFSKINEKECKILLHKNL